VPREVTTVSQERRRKEVLLKHMIGLLKPIVAGAVTNHITRLARAELNEVRRNLLCCSRVRAIHSLNVLKTLPFPCGRRQK